MIENPSNWAGNYTYGAAQFHQPQTVEQIQEVVVHSNKVKALGTRHSFNDIADSPGDLISVEHLNQIVRLDPERSTVTVEAGVRYGQLARWLHSQGYALHNLASLPHISVAGACATMERLKATVIIRSTTASFISGKPFTIYCICFRNLRYTK